MPVKAAPSTVSRPRDFMEVAITESTLMVARRTGAVSSSMSSYRAEMKNTYGKPKTEKSVWLGSVHGVPRRFELDEKRSLGGVAVGLHFPVVYGS